MRAACGGNENKEEEKGNTICSTISKSINKQDPKDSEICVVGKNERKNTMTDNTTNFQPHLLT